MTPTETRELLELAAKAAGIGVYWVTGTSGEEYCYLANDLPWNSLADDGDALRLAVKLQTPIMLSNEIVRCVWGNGLSESCVEPCGNDPYAATRRAIVRAAAEIGRNMK